MNIIPWRRSDTLTDMTRSMEDLMNSFWGNGDYELTPRLPQALRGRSMPPVNIAETEEAFVVTLDCPGMKEEDLDVQAMGNQLILTGERSWEHEKKGKEFHRVESQYGRFERTVQLPENAVTEDGQVDASYNKGVLTVTVPKRAKTPTTKIPVKAIK